MFGYFLGWWNLWPWGGVAVVDFGPKSTTAVVDLGPRFGPFSGLAGFLALDWGRDPNPRPQILPMVGFFNNSNDGFAGSRQVWHGLCRGGSPFLHWLRVAGGAVTNVSTFSPRRNCLVVFGQGGFHFTP